MKTLANRLLLLTCFLCIEQALGKSPEPVKVNITKPEGKPDSPEAIQQYESKGIARIDFQEGFKKNRVLFKLNGKKIFSEEISTDEVTALAKGIDVALRDPSSFEIEVDKKMFTFQISPKNGRFVGINYHKNKVSVQQSPHPPYYD
jgi:hypothetical protein